MCEKCIEVLANAPESVKRAFSAQNLSALKDTLRDMSEDVVTVDEAEFDPSVTEEQKAEFANEIAEYRGAHSMFTLLGYFFALSPYTPEQKDALLAALQSGINYGELELAAAEASAKH